MVKPPDVSAFRYAKRSLMAFLDGEQSLDWIVGVIGSSGIHGERLAEIFNELRDYPGDPARYEQALEACREKGWL